MHSVLSYVVSRFRQTSEPRAWPFYDPFTIADQRMPSIGLLCHQHLGNAILLACFCDAYCKQSSTLIGECCTGMGCLQEYCLRVHTVVLLRRTRQVRTSEPISVLSIQLRPRRLCTYELYDELCLHEQISNLRCINIAATFLFIARHSTGSMRRLIASAESYCGWAMLKPFDRPAGSSEDAATEPQVSVSSILGTE